MRLGQRQLRRILFRKIEARRAKFAQNRVDHAGCEAVTGMFGQLYALVDGCVGGDAVHLQNLESAQAQGNPDFGVEFGVGAFEQNLKLMIEPNLPAENAQHQRHRQVAVLGREYIDGFAAEKIVGVRLAALHGHENREGCLASGRDGGHRFQPNRASGPSGVPRKNSAAARCFLPSS